MKGIEITPDKWPGFCQSFSHLHRGWLVSISAFEPTDEGFGLIPDEAHAHRTSCDLPFAGLTLEPNQRDLMMRLGEGKLHISEPIRAVTRIRMLETEEGAHAGLRIDRSDHTGIMLMFRVAARSDELDGVAASER